MFSLSVFVILLPAPIFWVAQELDEWFLQNSFDRKYYIYCNIHNINFHIFHWLPLYFL